MHLCLTDLFCGLLSLPLMNIKVEETLEEFLFYSHWIFPLSQAQQRHEKYREIKALLASYLDPHVTCNCGFPTLFLRFLQKRFEVCLEATSNTTKSRGPFGIVAAASLVSRIYKPSGCEEDLI